MVSDRARQVVVDGKCYLIMKGEVGRARVYLVDRNPSRPWKAIVPEGELASILYKELKGVAVVRKPTIKQVSSKPSFRKRMGAVVAEARKRLAGGAH